jgi:sugar lactone lactonase YvrE
MNLLKLIRELRPHSIATIAGVGFRDGIPAKEAAIGWPLGVVRRPDGDLIVADYKGHRLLRIDKDGILHTFAGDGVPGDSGDGGPAIDARLYSPHDLALDKHGNLYFSDLFNHTYRRVDYETGIITRIAGSGRVGRGGEGGPALDAEFDTCTGIAVDDDGNAYLCGEWENNIRRIDANSGIIETFAGHSARHYTSERDASRPYTGRVEGTSFQWEEGLTLAGYHGDGGPAKDAGFHEPEHLAFDSRGDLYVCDNANHRIRKIDMNTGVITTVLGTGRTASNGDGGPAVEASTLMPDALCIDVHDNLYVGEKNGFRVRKVDARTGIVTTLVGTGVPGFGGEGLPGTQTQCNSCESGIWADPDGTVFWSDCSARLRRYDGRTGIVTTAMGGTSFHDGEPSTEGFLSGPGGICVGPDGHIYLADVWHQRIRAIDPASGIIRTVAGSGARAFGGDNGPATEAHLGSPHDVSVDSRGRVVITDTRHAHLRRVDEDGIIRNIAGAGFQWDRGDGAAAIEACLVLAQAVAHGPHDDVYVGDAVGRIRKIDDATGIITTIAGVGIQGYSGDGGPAVEARIGAPTAIRFDAEGNLYFSDSAYHLVRRVSTEGVISTVVGGGGVGFSPDGTPAREAKLHAPWGLAVTRNGVVYVSDSGNNRVRYVASDGTLQTVAGSDRPGDAGDGGPATAASLNQPHGLCLYGDDILLICDYYSNRIKAVKLATP